jgi:anti-sigma factor RsiW
LRWSGADAVSTDARNGYNIVRWAEGGMQFRAVSDVEAAQLAGFARLWREGA